MKMQIIDFDDMDCDDKEEFKEKLARLHRYSFCVPWKEFLGKFDSLEWSTRTIKQIGCECETCSMKKCFKCLKSISKKCASKIYGEFDEYPPRQEYFCDDCAILAVNVAHHRENVPF